MSNVDFFISCKIKLHFMTLLLLPFEKGFQKNVNFCNQVSCHFLVRRYKNHLICSMSTLGYDQCERV